MDVSSLRGIPVIESRPPLTEEGDLVVSVVEVPIINVSKDPDALWVLGLGLCEPAPGTIDVVPRLQGDDCVGERNHNTEHAPCQDHTEASSMPNQSSMCHLDTPPKPITHPIVLQNPKITAASIMRDIDSEIELQEADHVQVLREIDRTEFLRRHRPSLVLTATSLSLASLNQLLIWIVVLSLSSDLNFPDAWSVACAVFFLFEDPRSVFAWLVLLLTTVSLWFLSKIRNICGTLWWICRPILVALLFLAPCYGQFIYGYNVFDSRALRTHPHRRERRNARCITFRSIRGGGDRVPTGRVRRNVGVTPTGQFIDGDVLGRMLEPDIMGSNPSVCVLNHSYGNTY